MAGITVGGHKISDQNQVLNIAQGPGGDGDRRGQRGRAPPGDCEVVDHEGQHEVGGDQSRARADERLDARGQEHEREDGQRTTAPQRVR